MMGPLLDCLLPVTGWIGLGVHLTRSFTLKVSRLCLEFLQPVILALNPRSQTILVSTCS